MPQHRRPAEKLKGNRRHFLTTFATGSALGLTRPRPSTQVATRSAPERGMAVVLTGSGSALVDPFRGNASAAVLIDGTVLQFDCGRGALDNLSFAGVNPMRIGHLFFTHLHFDHIATYDYLVIATWIAGRRQPLRVFGPEGTREMSDAAIQGAHQVDQTFVRHLIQSWPDPENPPPPADVPVSVQDVQPGPVVESGDFTVQAANTPHYREMGVTSLAYRVDSKYGSVVISGDTAPSDDVVKLAQGADLLIHECVIPDPEMTSGGKFNAKPGGKRPPEGHTSPSQLGRLAQKAGVKKVVATHLPPYTSAPAAVAMSSKYYGSGQGPEIWSEFSSAIKRHFGGPVVLAEDALVIPVGGD